MPRTILLVDDEYSSVEVLALLFAQQGYDVVTASDGEEALKGLREKGADLVITDLTMPRMSGLELLERMQAHETWRTIPIVLMTAAYDSEEASHPAFAAVIGKPFKYDTLLATVRRLLGPDDPGDK